MLVPLAILKISSADPSSRSGTRTLRCSRDRVGRIAQLVRAPALHAGGRGFESLFAHSRYCAKLRDFSTSRTRWLLRGTSVQRLGGKDREVIATPCGTRPSALWRSRWSARRSLAQAAIRPAQRGGPPNAGHAVHPHHDVPERRSQARQSDMADELRKRIAGEHSAKELYVVPKNNINDTLEASGYKPDSALNASDLMELAKQLRGEYVIDGKVNKTGRAACTSKRACSCDRSADTWRSRCRQSTPRMPATREARSRRRSPTRSRHCRLTRPARTTCRAAKYDEAVKDAQRRHRGVSELGARRASACCTALRRRRRRRPTRSSTVANAHHDDRSDAHDRAGEPRRRVQARRATPPRRSRRNLAHLAQRIRRTRSASRRASFRSSRSPARRTRRCRSSTTLLVQNPGDPEMLQARSGCSSCGAKQYKQAIATGEEMVKVDTAAATLDYFNAPDRRGAERQQHGRGAAARDAGGQKFPNGRELPAAARAELPARPASCSRRSRAGAARGRSIRRTRSAVAVHALVGAEPD